MSRSQERLRKRPRPLSESPKRRENPILTTDTVIARRAYRPPERFLQGPANRHEFLATFTQKNNQNDRHTRKRRQQSTPPRDSHENQLNAQGILRPKFRSPALTCPYWLRHHLGWETKGCRNTERDCDSAHYYTGHVPDQPGMHKVIHSSNVGFLYPKQFRCKVDLDAQRGHGRPCKNREKCKYRHQGDIETSSDVLKHSKWANIKGIHQWARSFIQARRAEFDKFLEGKGVLHKTDDDSVVDEKTGVKEEPENSD